MMLLLRKEVGCLAGLAQVRRSRRDETLRQLFNICTRYRAEPTGLGVAAEISGAVFHGVLVEVTEGR